MKKEPSNKIKKQYISAAGLESVFPDDTLDLIDLCYFDANEYMCLAGDDIEVFHIIIKGRCKVMPSSETGKEILLSYLEPISLCGDIELFNNCPALHCVKADNKVAAIAIRRKIFFDEMMNRPPFLKMVCKYFAFKIYMSSQKHSSNMLYPIKNRLNRLLLKAAEEQQSTTVRLNISESARQLGVSTRHIRRVLSSYEEKNIIRRRDSKIDLLDLEALQSESSHFQV